MERLEEGKRELEVRVRLLEEENTTLQETYDYLTANTIPELKTHYELMERQVGQMQQEMGALKGENWKLREHMDMGEELEKTKNLVREKEELLRRVNEDLKCCYANVDKMDSFIREQQEQIERDLKPQITKLKL